MGDTATLTLPRRHVPVGRVNSAQAAQEDAFDISIAIEMS
jgi:hypothetical protein